MKTKILIGVMLLCTITLFVYRDLATPSPVLASIHQPKSASTQMKEKKVEQKVTLSLSVNPTFAP